jgi:hypothetical protein
VTADEAYGQNPTFRTWLAAHEVPFVLATRNDDVLISPDGHRRQAKVLATIAGTAADGWERRSIGPVRTVSASTTGPRSRSTPRGCPTGGGTGCWFVARPGRVRARSTGTWASTPPVSRRSRQSATGPPRGYPDRTHTGKRRRADDTRSTTYTVNLLSLGARKRLNESHRAARVCRLEAVGSGGFPHDPAGDLLHLLNG